MALNKKHNSMVRYNQIQCTFANSHAILGISFVDLFKGRKIASKNKTFFRLSSILTVSFELNLHCLTTLSRDSIQNNV